MCLTRPKMTSHESPKTRSGTLARAILGENQPPDPIKMTPDRKKLRYLIVGTYNYLYIPKIILFHLFRGLSGAKTLFCGWERFYFFRVLPGLRTINFGLRPPVLGPHVKIKKKKNTPLCEILRWSRIWQNKHFLLGEFASKMQKTVFFMFFHDFLTFSHPP